MSHGIIVPKLRPMRRLVEDLHEGGFRERETALGPEYVRERPGAAPGDVLGVPGSGRLRAARWMALCSTCEHARAAADSGAEVCGRACGGPSDGLAYPSYRGLPRDVWTHVCYVCGEDAVTGIMRPGWPAHLAVCARHGGAR